VVQMTRPAQAYQKVSSSTIYTTTGTAYARPTASTRTAQGFPPGSAAYVTAVGPAAPVSGAGSYVFPGRLAGSTYTVPQAGGMPPYAQNQKPMERMPTEGDAASVSLASSCTGTRPALSRSSSEATIMPAEEEPIETEARRVVKHVCPTCGDAFWTHEEVRAHWLQEHRPVPTPPAGDVPAPADAEARHRSAEVAQPTQEAGLKTAEASSTDEAQETMRAKIVEVDEQGQPVIVREEDPNPRTIVTNEDGSRRAFGEAIVKALLANDTNKVTAWITSMTDRTLRGLINELSERFFILQRQLLRRREQLKEQQRSRGLALFSLEEDCTAKDLETAYRRLARSMHPDKNGGTEEAKERFQTMRARYEELKEQFEHGSLGPVASKECSGASGTGGEATGSGEDERAEEETSSPKETTPDNEGQQCPTEEAAAEAEDSEPTTSQQTSAGATSQQQEKVFFCRSKDPSELQGCVQQIVKKMQILSQNLDMVERNFIQASQ